MRKKRLVKTTATNVDIELQFDKNGTLITPLFNFYLDLRLQCTKIHQFVKWTPREVFNGFVQSVGDARRSGDENPLSGVVAETIKLLRKSSYIYQIMRTHYNIQ